ncbi:hypothetical protein V8E53_001426 [Lactarius tabidus]
MPALCIFVRSSHISSINRKVGNSNLLNNTLPLYEVVDATQLLTSLSLYIVKMIAFKHKQAGTVLQLQPQDSSKTMSVVSHINCMTTTARLKAPDESSRLGIKKTGQLFLDSFPHEDVVWGVAFTIDSAQSTVMH